MKKIMNLNETFCIKFKNKFTEICEFHMFQQYHEILSNNWKWGIVTWTLGEEQWKYYLLYPGESFLRCVDTRLRAASLAKCKQ